jgi:CopA family copper-resistance protein
MKLFNVINKQFLVLMAVTLTIASNVSAQSDTTVYYHNIDKKAVNITGKDVIGMAVNGTVPGPTLRFKEHGYAVIYVKNEMDEETSVHWHGLLLPNYYDGVPYLTIPPIRPGETLKYEFPLRQAGTYWYHSHTLLQEQSGVYGSIVIESKNETLEYDKELVMVLSDWTNQKPMNVLRNLKRGNEWYNIKKGTATPLNRVIARGGFEAQLNFWKQRMESADIADIYYPAFLNNGLQIQEYPQYKPGEKVRLRIINGAASSQFWLTFGGESPLLVAADGLNVVPVKRNKTFIAIAETYDFIVTIPEKGKIEFKATAQDGSGHSSAYLGKGDIIPAPEVPRPDKIGMMMKMAKMDMRMGAPAMKFRPGKEDALKQMNNWGMQMDEEMDHSTMNHSASNENEMIADTMQNTVKMSKNKTGMSEMNMYSEYNYDYLKSPEKTNFSQDKPRKEVLLNLTGNMWRYIWSMNGVPLSEADKIKIEKGQVVRITLNNLTMMHHPMHLHGHFFRVINKNGEYSPLKHTVNVPAMQKVIIEFDASESGDWFFHCHVLYHLMGGMARVYSYGTPDDPRMADYPLKKLIHETDRYYSWGLADVASHMTGLNLVYSNTRNQFNMNVEYGYNQNMEGEVTYERYLYDYLRVFGGLNIENKTEKSLDEISTTAVVGIRFFTPYMFNLDVRVDNKLRPEIRLSRAIMIFPRTSIFGNYEYQADFGAVNQEATNELVDYKGETTWSAGVEYFLSRNFSLMASYDNRFGAGGGLSIRF